MPARTIMTRPVLNSRVESSIWPTTTELIPPKANAPPSAIHRRISLFSHRHRRWSPLHDRGRAEGETSRPRTLAFAQWLRQMGYFVHICQHLTPQRSVCVVEPLRYATR